MTSTLPRILSAICLVCLAHSVRAEERLAPIRDDAKLFSATVLPGLGASTVGLLASPGGAGPIIAASTLFPGRTSATAIDRAEQRIADIYRTFDHRLFVRTVVSVSPGQGRWFLLRTPQVNRMLEEQARKYADEVGIPGIYVVICTRPRDVHVVVRPQDDPQFTHRDAEALRRMLARSLHDQGADAALRALVDQVHSVLQDHATRGSSSAGNDIVIAGLLGGGLGLWLLLRMIRYKMRNQQAATSWQEGSVSDPRTQSRETAALFGALFGFPGGLWIYDKLYPCPPGVTPPCQPSEEPAPAVVEDTSAKRDGDQHPLPEPAEDASVLP